MFLIYYTSKLSNEFNNWCNNKGVKNSFVNYIWWKDNVLNKGGK